MPASPEQVAGTLRRLQADLPIVVMGGSGRVSGGTNGEFEAEFLAKPFQAETLLSIVRRTLAAALREAKA